jgi:hypothetical protein
MERWQTRSFPGLRKQLRARVGKCGGSGPGCAEQELRFQYDSLAESSNKLATPGLVRGDGEHQQVRDA